MRRTSFFVTLLAIALLGWGAAAHVPSGVAAQEASPPAQDAGQMPPGITFQPLGYADVPEMPLPGFAVMVRVTIAPGASLPGDPSDPEFTFLYVESGALTVNADKPLTIMRAAAMAVDGAPEAAVASTDVSLATGDSLGFPPNTGGVLRNDGTDSAVVLLVNIVPGGAGEATPIS